MSRGPVLIGGVILLRDDGACLLQHRDDKPGLPHRALWVPPGGHCDGDEPIDACAAREFLEETAYRCERLHYLETVELGGPGFPDVPVLQRLTMFWAEYDGEQDVECREGQALDFIRREDASRLPIPAYLVNMWDNALAARARRAGQASTGESMDQQRDLAEFAAESRRRCTAFRRRILEMSQTVSALHVGGSFSCLEILDAIFFGLMRHGQTGGEPDTFLLSKGHGSLALYVILEQRGVLSKEDIAGYCKPGGRLGTHPDYGTPGIEASTGSLGHGLPLALGMSLADKRLSPGRTVFVTMSDGELQEGSVWEALMLAPSLGITNICAFVDLNDFQSLGRTSETLPNFYPIVDKLRAFGWETVEVDGHDGAAIVDVARGRRGDKPFIAVCRTTKGKGVSYMENVPMWHYRSPSPEEYQQALRELDESERLAEVQR